jgi:hypothetical protein
MIYVSGCHTSSNLLTYMCWSCPTLPLLEQGDLLNLLQQHIKHLLIIASWLALSLVELEEL